MDHDATSHLRRRVAGLSASVGHRCVTLLSAVGVQLPILAPRPFAALPRHRPWTANGSPASSTAHSPPLRRVSLAASTDHDPYKLDMPTPPNERIGMGIIAANVAVWGLWRVAPRKVMLLAFTSSFEHLRSRLWFTPLTARCVASMY